MEGSLTVDRISPYVGRDAHPERDVSHAPEAEADPVQAILKALAPQPPQLRCDLTTQSHTATATFDALLFVNKWAAKASAP